MKKLMVSWALAGVAMALASGAQAAYVTYFGEDLNNSETTQLASLPNATAAQSNFLGNFSSAGVENFETRSVGAVSPLPLSFVGANGNTLSATLSGSGSVGSNSPGQTNGFGRYSVPGGTRYWETDAAAFTVTFGQDIAAFGFFGVDIGDFGGTLLIDVRNAAGNIISTLNVPNTQGADGSTGGSVLYFGLVASTPSELFRSISFRTSTGAGDTFAFDSFTIAESAQVGPGAVPEPTSLALAGLALLGLGWSRRRAG